MFEKAEPMYQKSIILRKKLYGETNPVVATALNHLAIFQVNIGNFKKAEKTALEGLEVAGKSLDVSSITHATLSNTLGMAYLEQKKFDLALETFQKTAKILEENSEENNPIYLTVLSNISATINEDTTKDISVIEPILLYVIEKMRSIYSEGQPQYLSALNNLAIFYKANDEFEKAEKLYETILNVYKKNIGQNSWKYITFLWNAALNAELMGKHEEAQARYKKCFEIMKNLTIQDFVFLSEEEREYYWFARTDMIKHFQEYAIRAKLLDPSLTALAYNLELFSKNLLLNSSVKLQEAILNNPATADLWEEMKRLKNKQVNKDKVQKIEKELIVRSKEYHSLQDEISVDWTTIKKMLNRNEAAIEFINFSPQTISENKDIIYFALLVRQNSDYPEIIKLCYEKDILEAIASSENNFEKLYTSLWNPIDSYLDNITEIYLSPSGFLNTIPFAALKNKGEYISDKYTIHTILSSKDIIVLKNDSTQLSNKNAILFGGADFSLPIAELDKSADIVSNNEVLRSLIIDYQEQQRGQGFDYLPGSKQEVEKISEILLKQNWKVSTFTDKKATESRLKSSLSQDSPSLLHISTHGYYFPLVKEPARISESSEFNKFHKQSDNPLIRSGLLFSGANNTWNGQEQPEDTDDGILTAYEISNLNMSNTDLVVLSACETGLGDVNYSEGVYGLQRAFRLAGVKSMIVSLWKVADKDALEFMVEFYQQWAIYKDKKKAFDKAQSKMRKKHDEIKKWAGFILIE